MAKLEFGVVRGLALVAALAACGSDKPARTGEPAAPSTVANTAMAAPVALESLVHDGVTGIVRRTSPASSLFDAASGIVASAPPCVAKLRAAIREDYQLEVGADRTSYVIFAGALPRAEVEACARAVMAAQPAVQVRSEGETLIVKHDHVPDELHLVWRGGWLLAGGREELARALRGTSPEAAARWRERFGMLPAAGLAAWSDNALLENLIGVSTTQYLVTFDTAQKPTPKPDFTFRVIAHYATPADAAIAARKVKAADIEPRFAPPRELTAAIKKFEVKQHDETIDITMRSDMFEQAGVDFAVMETWVRGMAAQPSGAN